MTTLAPAEIDRAIEVLTGLNQQVAELIRPTQPDRTGGYSCIATDVPLADAAAVHHLAVALIGTIVADRHYLYRNFAQEKATRLLALFPEHRSSWQSRDEAQKRFGGAVRIPRPAGPVVVAFSGYPERWDESLCLALAVRMGWTERAAAEAIAHETTRPCLVQLLEG
jgi:hypothetical protein